VGVVVPEGRYLMASAEPSSTMLDAALDIPFTDAQGVESGLFVNKYLMEFVRTKP
jgi:hypothetical protein